MSKEIEMLWTCFGDDSSTPRTRVLHWHRRKVPENWKVVEEPRRSVTKSSRVTNGDGADGVRVTKGKVIRHRNRSIRDPDRRIGWDRPRGSSSFSVSQLRRRTIDRQKIGRSEKYVKFQIKSNWEHKRCFRLKVEN
jgi:hypothetical protein